jgi:two-component system, chemotaxis family, response regulator PixG
MQLIESELENNPSLSADAVQLIRQHLQIGNSGCLEISSNTVRWFLYLDCGQIVYLTNSIDPIDRLDCHLKGLSRRVPSIDNDVRTLIRLSIDLQSATPQACPDLQGIALLEKDGFLSPEATAGLATELSREALESLLLVQDYTYTFHSVTGSLGWYYSINFEQLLSACKDRIQAWQALNPLIWSPYQRPYLFSQSQSANKLTPETQQRLGKLLKGFSFRHLALLLGQDELKLVKSLSPLIADKVILLRDPQSPYSDLPIIKKVLELKDLPTTEKTTEEATLGQTELSDRSDRLSHPPADQPTSKLYRIACIDDSPAMLQTIERFLEKEDLSLFLIQESVKALIELMRIKPDLILLDVGMPQVDGYELCRLLRRHPMFKSTPIIMVTGNTGLIDRAKAKLAGTTDYMTKPFTQAELSKMVFRHLT